MKTDRNKLFFFITLIPIFLLFLFSELILNKKEVLPENYKSHPVFSENCLKENKEHIVISVCDGDTLIIGKRNAGNLNPNNYCKHDIELPENIYKVRLIGVDAFEMKQNVYGKLGKNFLKKEALGKNVCIELDKEEKDRYKRTLGYVFLNDIFLNQELVKNGFALESYYKPNDKYRSVLKEAQADARKNMSGVWEKADYISETPAQFRKKGK